MPTSQSETATPPLTIQTTLLGLASTGDIQYNDSLLLTQKALHICLMENEYGYLLSIPSDDISFATLITESKEKGFSDHFLQLLLLAKSQNIHYLSIDQAQEPLSGEIHRSWN